MLIYKEQIKAKNKLIYKKKIVQYNDSEYKQPINSRIIYPV